MRVHFILLALELLFISGCPEIQGHLIILTRDDQPGSIVFEAAPPSSSSFQHSGSDGRNHPAAYDSTASSGRRSSSQRLTAANSRRTYTLNVDRSGSFVRKLLDVDQTNGAVRLKKHPRCDGIHYPNLFTAYVDSTANTTLDYLSIPLRVLIEGCAELVSFQDGVVVNEGQDKISEAKRWPSETIASFAFPILKKDTGAVIKEICLKPSQLIGHIHSLVPSTVAASCEIHFGGPTDPRFSVEARSGDLVVSHETLCLNQMTTTVVTVPATYTCSGSSPLVSPGENQIKISIWFRETSDPLDTGRVRRMLRPGDLSFDKALYIASVLEEQAPPVEVCTVAVKGQALYSMVSLLDSRSAGLFTIGASDGIVTTTARLDRETMDVHYFRITATSEDGSVPTRSATTTLQINVGDTNDHAPIFEGSVGSVGGGASGSSSGGGVGAGGSGLSSASLSESAPVGSVVAQLRASDVDIGINAQIEYSIVNIESGGLDSGEGMFSIDPQSGIITTRQTLDRETAEIYTIVAQATDSAQPIAARLSSTVSLVVRILDENDNYPQFGERTTTVNLPEETTSLSNPVIATVRASDADSGQNGALRYALIGGNTQGQFAIDSQSGEISLVKPLDYESIRSYRLVIRAQDGGSPGKSNTTQVLVNVKDYNDNAPRFYTSLFQESVSEDVPVGFSIVRVQAYDADEGVNAEIEYKISDHFSPATLPVSVDSASGWLFTNRELDRETESKLHFEVLAVDHGSPPKTGTTTLSIVVQDTNDNDPEFSPREYSANLAEDSVPGTSVVAVHATDSDENPRLHYEIASGNTRGRFAITTQNGRGLITVAQPLDYKQERRFVLVVKATDSGGRSDSANVYLNITDSNTFSPVFDNAPYAATLPEDSKIGSTVLVVSASDGDTGVNAQITYSLSSETDHFAINADTGAIITTSVLDRETTPGYLLSVTAKDNGTPQLSDTTDVEITVTDVNDNAPKFSQDSYTISVSEDVPIGTSVIQVSATDGDIGLNGRVRYTLEQTDTFIMEPITGVVRVNRALDRESVPTYDLIAVASDRATPPLSSTVTIHVIVEDVNDSPPTFSSDRLTLYIPENSPVGSTVGEIYASDPDIGPNAVVQYSVIGGEDSSSFSLQRRAGTDRAELITLVELDYESDKKEFKIVVRATSAPLRSDAQVTVVVTDVNDNAPILPDFQVVFNNFRECFPSGPIGTIPAVDADVSDKLRYRLLSGNNAHLVALNETTGELTLSPQLNTNVPKVATMEVSVSDGVNEVKAWMELNVRLITDDMLTNSVTVRLAEMTSQAFLSPLYSYFVEAIAAIVPCPKHNVYLFSVQDDPDVGDMRVLNVSFSVRQPDGQMLPAQMLQERVHLNRALLNKLSTIQVLQFDDNLCVREPCLNFEECLTVLKFGNASDFVASETMLFRPIYPVTTFVCRCPKGFIGKEEHYLCDTEINLCYSNPCKNNGECKQAEGGYTCICKPGFTGDTCETDMTETCKDSCPRGSTCTPLESGGYACESCAPAGGSFQNYGRSCEARARSFYPGSYLTFQPIRQRNRIHLSLKFSTVESHGLLLYNGRYNLRHDFIALELVESYTVEFSFSLGSRVTSVAAVSEVPLNDGAWHTVTVTYHNRTVVVSLDQCDASLAVKFGDKINVTCAAKVSQELESRCALVTESCHRFLDLTGPLQLGGLPPGMINPRLSQTSFSGCIADVHIDHRLLDMNKFVANNGTKVGCVERDSFCSSSPCQNGGTCSDSWGTFLCQCADGWSGHDCSQSVPPSWHFNGEGQLVFNPLLRPIQLPWETQFSIRTLQTDAFVLGVSVGQNSSALFTIEDGYLKYAIDSDEVVLKSWKVADGRWHRAVASVTPGGLATLTLDGAWSSSGSVRTNPQKQFIGRLVVAMETGFRPFLGCIKDIRLGSWQGLQLIQNPTTATGVGQGCPEHAECPESCPPNRHCSLNWLTSSCDCNTGYVGKECTSVCSLNPCENEGLCSSDRDSPLGYSCACNETLYSGDYCENEKTRTCPSSWWGRPNCGPCNCDLEKGYSPQCNQTNGKCHCRENHYFVSDETGCAPCACYALGSLSTACDPATGQCDCKPGVVGQQCDQCPNGYAQVTSRGCEVVYGGCPRSHELDIWWERTEFGSLSETTCPNGSVGKAKRLCDKALPGWRSPDVFNCTSSDFVPLRRLLNQLETGDVSLNTYVATETARSLVSALNATTSIQRRDRNLFGADVLVTFELVGRLLRHEANLTGLSLTHVQQSGYTDRLVWLVSELLSYKTVPFWPRVKQLTNQQPHNLHTLFTLYMTTLTADMRDTYTPPFETVTSNLVLGLDTVSPESLFGYEVPKQEASTSQTEFKETIILPDTSSILQPPIQAASLVRHANGSNSPTVVFPKYNNYMKSGAKFDEFSRILIPLELLGIKNVAQGDISTKARGRQTNSATVSYAFYREGNVFMAGKFDHTVTSRWGVAVELGSSIVTVVAANKDGAVISSGLKTPARIQLWLNQPVVSPRNNPQCVRWTHVRGFGEWTRAGCLTELPQGEWWRQPVVLVNCTCSTLSTHALVVDLVAEQYVREPSEAEEVYTWVGLCVTIWCLASCILVIELTSNLGKANHSTILANFAMCLLLADVLYLTALKVNLVSMMVWCKLVAMALHYLWLCGLAWSLIYSLHIYGMLTQLRDTNRDPMATQYVCGYGLPGVVVGLSAALRSHQYGNYYFCWISIHESVIWAMVGPGVFIVAAKLIVLFMSLKAAFTVNHSIVTYGNLRTLLWVDVGCLPLLVAAWLSVLVNASNHSPYATAGMAVILPLHSAALLVSTAAASPTLRRLVLRMTGGKAGPPVTTEPSSPPPRSAMAYRAASTGASSGAAEIARRQLGISNSSTTSRSTTKTSSSPYRSDAQLRNTSTSTSNYDGPSHGGGSTSGVVGHQRGGGRVTHTSESESEGSEPSLELASSHSSDEETSRGHNSTLPSTANGVSNRWAGSVLGLPYPPQLNIDSDLFKAVYPGTTRIPDDGGLPYRWTSSTISDNELGVYRASINGRPGSDIKLSNVYSDQENEASVGEKYLFPYTAEEDHTLTPARAYQQCTSPYPPTPQLPDDHSPSPLTLQHDYMYPDISENEEYEENYE